MPLPIFAPSRVFVLSWILVLLRNASRCDALYSHGSSKNPPKGWTFPLNRALYPRGIELRFGLL